MWTHKIFSVFDSKAKGWLPPFTAVNAAVAIRMFERAVNDGQSDFHRFSSDYSLFEIGLFSEDSGEVQGVEPKVNLGVAVEFLKNKEVTDELASRRQ